MYNSKVPAKQRAVCGIRVRGCAIRYVDYSSTAARIPVISRRTDRRATTSSATTCAQCGRKFPLYISGSWSTFALNARQTDIVSIYIVCGYMQISFRFGAIYPFRSKHKVKFINRNCKRNSSNPKESCRRELCRVC